jgi:hypothetical protein
MRDQYAGDISDFLKYALLRELSNDGRSLGVAWYYNTTHDGRADGRHVEYLEDRGWATLDEPLWQALKELPDRSVAAIETLPIWPSSTMFHRAQVPPGPRRADWASEMCRQLADCDLVFVDPDIGLGPLKPSYVTLEEIKALRRPGRTVVLIKFPAHVKFDIQEDAYHAELQAATGANRIMTLRSSVAVPSTNGRKMPRLRWFTLLDHDEILADRISAFATRLDMIPGAWAHIRQSQCANHNGA